MSADGIEHEVKLAVHPTFSLPSFDLPEGLHLEEGTTRRLTAVYWDTADLRLVRAGVTLRHRSASDGSEAGWTVKLGEATGAPGAEGLGLTRREVEAAGDPSEPPPAVVGLVQVLTRGAALAPVAKLVTKRTVRSIVDTSGAALLELDDDEVSVLHGLHVAARFRELEVEVVGPGDGSVDLVPVLRSVVGALVDAGASAADQSPKVVRALGARSLVAPDVVEVDLHRGCSAGDAVRAAIGAALVRIVRHDPGIRLVRFGLPFDDEDVHQARVACRRLRSDLKTFEPLLDEGWVAETATELRWLAGELGQVRDADVLHARLSEQAADLGPADRRAAADLLTTLMAERDAAREVVLAALESSRYVALLDRLVAAAAEPPLTDAAGEDAEDALPPLVADAWKHLRKAVEHLEGVDHDHGDEALHEVRKKAKRARYACEAVTPVVGKDAKRLGKAIASIQTVLGELQDAVVAEAWLREHAAGAGGPGHAFAAGLLAGVQHAAMAEARAAWRTPWRAAKAKELRGWLT